MGYGLGVDLGTTYTAAAVHVEGRVEVVRLGAQRAEIPSAVYLTPDGTVLVGEAAERRGAADPGRLAREFKRRVGDPVPVRLGGAPYSAHALTARMLEHVVRTVAGGHEGPPDAITVTHPANWGPYKRELLEQAVRLADVTASLCPEPHAAAVQHAAGERVAPGEIVAVYDLGGGTFDAAILRKTDGGFELLGESEGIEQLGGVDFDEAVLGHVTGTLAAQLDGLDPEDEEVVTALARLRRDCVAAKEALSFDTEVLIPVALPALHTRVRLNRAEFEAMIAPALADTIAAMRRALRSAGVGADRLRTILLAGGSARIPLVGQLVTAAFDRPAVLDPHPEHSIALGAARMTDPGATATPPPARPRRAPAPAPADDGPAPARTPTAAPVPADHGPAPAPARTTAAVPGPADHGPAPAPDGPDGSASRRRGRRLLAAVPIAVAAAVVLAGVAWANREDPSAGRTAGGPVAATTAATSAAPACGFADEFTGGAVDPRWEALPKEGGLTVANGALELTAPDGADIYPQHLDAPMLLQTPTGDFTLETDVAAAPRQFYQGAGLVLWQDSEHYVRLERGFGDVGAIALEYRDGGRHIKVHAPFAAGPAVVRTDAGRVVLQLRRTSGAVAARWRPSGETGWRDLGRIGVALPDTTRAGVAGLNRAQNGATPAPFRARFDYVRVSC